MGGEERARRRCDGRLRRGDVGAVAAMTCGNYLCVIERAWWFGGGRPHGWVRRGMVAPIRRRSGKRRAALWIAACNLHVHAVSTPWLSVALILRLAMPFYCRHEAGFVNAN